MLTILMIGLIILSILNILGLVYLTRFSFQGKAMKVLNKSVTCVDDVDDKQLNIAKVTVVLLWIQLSISFLVALGNFMGW